MYFARYKKSRFWGVYDHSSTLICLCVYKKGAEEVIRRLPQELGKEKNNDANVSVSLGQVMLTPGAVAALEQAGQTPEQLLARHSFRDWGELDAEDWARNNHALENGLLLLSSYRLQDNTKIWVITEWDRSSTTLLLPQEY